MNRSETHFCSQLSAPGGCERNKAPQFVSNAHQNESLKGIKDGKVILPAWLGTCTLPHRCSLFTGAAINLHARGYESTARRAEFKSQKEFFKVKRSEQGSYFSDQIDWTAVTHERAGWRVNVAMLGCCACDWHQALMKTLIDTWRSGKVNRRPFGSLWRPQKSANRGQFLILLSLYSSVVLQSLSWNQR